MGAERNVSEFLIHIHSLPYENLWSGSPYRPLNEPWPLGPTLKWLPWSDAAAGLGDEKAVLGTVPWST